MSRDDGEATADRDLVGRLLARLPEQQRRVVVLRYYTDLSEQSTADLLNISVGSVKSAASRGLSTLRAALVAGHRVVRRRGLAMVGGTAVVIAVMGAGGWAAQAQLPEQSQRPLPASTGSVASSATATLELRSEEPGPLPQASPTRCEWPSTRRRAR